MKWCARRHGFILVHLPEGTEFMPVLLFRSSLQCVTRSRLPHLCFSVRTEWVRGSITGLKQCAMKFIKVSGPLWWKTCEGISALTLARFHKKPLISLCFVIKILPSYFGSQGLDAALTLAVYTVCWIVFWHPLGKLWQLESSKSCLAGWESDWACFCLLCRLETNPPYSICVCSIQFPFGDWLTRCVPVHHNHHIIYLVVIKSQIMERKINNHRLNLVAQNITIKVSRSLLLWTQNTNGRKWYKWNPHLWDCFCRFVPVCWVSLSKWL